MIRYEGDVENYIGLSLNFSSPNYVAKKLAGSQLVEAEVEASDEISNPVSVIFGEGKVSGTITFAGGSDGSESAVNAGTFIGEDHGPGKRTGIASFMENTVTSIIAVPGVTIPDVVVSLVAHCENEKNRFAVIDIPKETIKTQDIIEYRGMVDSTYAAMYHPWLQVFDRVTKKPGFVPPSGAVCGVYSRTDVGRGVHKAPANEIVNCTGLSVNYNTGEQDILNPAGVNLIRAIPARAFASGAPVPLPPTRISSMSTSGGSSSSWSSPSRTPRTGSSSSPITALCGPECSSPSPASWRTCSGPACSPARRRARPSSWTSAPAP
jgi:hypothetical protein